jgi:hypothetical protein
LEKLDQLEMGGMGEIDRIGEMSLMGEMRRIGENFQKCIVPTWKINWIQFDQFQV